MADEKKYTEHIVRGSVPRDEWRKFLKQHFAPSPVGGGGGRPTGGGTIDESASDTCGSLGCTLHHCSVDVEADGSATIHCYYTARENR
jgi:hypothetical protein